jgi:hypothetical protein
MSKPMNPTHTRKRPFLKSPIHLFAVIAIAASGGSAFAQKVPTPRKINVDSQLMITDLRVVEDPVRTNPRLGTKAPWTFNYLIESMAGKQNPSDFAMQWLQQWETDQTINGHVAKARPDIRKLVIDPWLKASGGRKLDLAKAPFKLLAIVNRMDLRVQDGTKVATAGEGRFVFGVLGADGKPLPPLAGDAPGGFTVIFEYELVATKMEHLRDWAMRWAKLGDYPVGSPLYNQALEGVTRKFTDRGIAALKPNGSALNQVRTNELALGAPWELREFGIDAASGRLKQRPVAVTPDVLALNGTPALATLVNDNEAALLAETFVLPKELLAASSLAGPFQLSDFPDSANRTFTTTELFAPFFDVPWSAAGIRSNDARHSFALNTCSGCHRGETGTAFLQIGFPVGNKLPRSLGKTAALAGFLTGIDTPDPVVPATTRSFGDLNRRKADLEELLATFGPTGGGPGPRGRHVPNFVH